MGPSVLEKDIGICLYGHYKQSMINDCGSDLEAVAEVMPTRFHF